MRHRPRQYAMAALVAIACVAAWTLGAPAAMGGPVTYAVIHGTSMEPRLHDGDLVLLRSASSYRPGDVVGYRDPKLDRLVLHRIIRRDGTHFVTKGDNNSFRDPSTPTADQVAGQLWARIPRAGGLIAALHRPLPVALLVGFIALGPLESRRRRRTAVRPDGHAGPSAPSLEARRAAFFVCLIAGCALAALAVYAFSRPPAVATQVSNAYRLSGTFSYRATSTPGATYPDGVVHTGDAVFVALSHEVALTFAYGFASSLSSRLSGHASMDLVISDGSGWRRRVALVANRPFTAAGDALVGIISLERLQAIVGGMERETGTSQSEYSVVVRPVVAVDGAVDGSPVHTRFAPSLAFRLDPSRLTLSPTADGGPPPLVATHAGTIAGSDASAVSVVGARLSVEQLRAIGLFGAEAALAAAVLLGLPLLKALRGSETERIRSRLGSRLIDVDELPSIHPGGVVRVSELAVLIRIADREEATIMVATDEVGSHYGLVSRGILYRFSSAAAHPAPAAEPAR